MAKQIKLSEVQIADLLYVSGFSSFCQDDYELVTTIGKRIDKETGGQYPVIVSGGDIYHGITGAAIKGEKAYQIVSVFRLTQDDWALYNEQVSREDKFTILKEIVCESQEEAIEAEKLLQAVNLSELPQNRSRKFIYSRVSTEKQDYVQQKQCISAYFARTGIDPASIDAIIVEKKSGMIDHAERKLGDLLKICKQGDTIYVSQLSRIGRCMSDIFAIVTECCKKGVTIIQCKDGTNIENNSVGGKALLFALSLAAEIEVANIHHLTQMGINARKGMLARDGQFISNSGKVCTHLGNAKGVDTRKAGYARGKQKQNEAMVWRQNSLGYRSVFRWLKEGKSTKEILQEFNAMHKISPKDFSTPRGCELTESLLKRWRVEMKDMLLN